MVTRNDEPDCHNWFFSVGNRVLTRVTRITLSVTRNTTTNYLIQKTKTKPTTRCKKGLGSGNPGGLV